MKAMLTQGNRVIFFTKRLSRISTSDL